MFLNISGYSVHIAALMFLSRDFVSTVNTTCSAGKLVGVSPDLLSSWLCENTALVFAALLALSWS